MDPDATLTAICESLFQLDSDCTYANTLDAIGNLADWLIAGGFKPPGSKAPVSCDDVITGTYWFCLEHRQDTTHSYEHLLQMCARLYAPPGGIASPTSGTTGNNVYRALFTKMWTAIKKEASTCFCGEPGTVAWPSDRMVCETCNEEATEAEKC